MIQDEAKGGGESESETETQTDSELRIRIQARPRLARLRLGADRGPCQEIEGKEEQELKHSRGGPRHPKNRGVW